MISRIESETDRKQLVDFINNLKLDKVWLVNIKRLRKMRSISQNSLYHLWKSVLAEEFGNTPNEMHDILRRRYLSINEKEVLGEVYEILQSTTTLNTKEFSNFLDAIYIDFSAEGIILPKPGDRGFEEMYEKYKDIS